MLRVVNLSSSVRTSIDTFTTCWSRIVTGCCRAANRTMASDQAHSLEPSPRKRSWTVPRARRPQRRRVSVGDSRPDRQRRSRRRPLRLGRFDSLLTLYDERGTTLAISDEPDTPDSRLTFLIITTSGRYSLCCRTHDRGGPAHCVWF